MDTVDERVTILTSAVCARSLSRAGDAQNMTGLSNQAARATTLTSTRSSSSATHARPRAIGDHRERRARAWHGRPDDEMLKTTLEWFRTTGPLNGRRITAIVIRADSFVRQPTY